MKLRHYAVLAALATALPTVALPADDEKAKSSTTFATVNGTKISQTLADAMIGEQKTQGNADSPELRNQVKEELVRREILAQDARKKGFDKKPDVIAQMDLAKDAVLIRAYLQDFVKAHPITDSQLKEEYEKIVKGLGKKEYKARHILVDKEDEAKAIVDKLKKGEKFETLAKQSKDTGSKEKGGELGWAPPANYVKPFGDALVGLQKGKSTDKPVKTDFGYHIIELQDVRDLKLPTFEESKAALQQRLQQQSVQKHIMGLRENAKVE